MPSLNVDCKRKLKLVLDREYVSQEEIYKENVEPALNLLMTQTERINNLSPSIANVLGYTPTYSHQGTPTGTENFIKLENVLAGAQDVLWRKP